MTDQPFVLEVDAAADGLVDEDEAAELAIYYAQLMAEAAASQSTRLRHSISQ